MTELTIEWRHYAKGNATCERCSATGTSVKEVVTQLTQELSSRGITVSFIETALPEELMAQSNMILFNGTALEELLDNAITSESECPSCSCLTGNATVCRTVEHEGVIHEEIPADLIRRAALRALDMAE